MGRIKLEDIKKEAESYGWTLLSLLYKNLDTELMFLCPLGHKVCSPYKKWRVNVRCPVCDKGFVKKLLSKGIPKKQLGVKRILALDDATGTTGYSILDGEKLIHYGKVTMTLDDPILRILSLRLWLISMVQNWNPDIVGILDIQLQGRQFGSATILNVKSFKVLAQLQGVLLITLMLLKIKYYIVPSASWRSTCGFTTKTRSDQKRLAQNKVKDWYDISATQDLADAICIGYHMVKKYCKSNKIVWGDDI